MSALSPFQHTRARAGSYRSITELFAWCLLLFLYLNFVLVLVFCREEGTTKTWTDEIIKNRWKQRSASRAIPILIRFCQLGGFSMFLSNWPSCSQQSLSFHSSCKKSARFLLEPFDFNGSSHLSFSNFSVQSECSLPEQISFESSLPDIPPIRTNKKMINPPSAVWFHTWGDSIPAQLLVLTPTGMFFFIIFIASLEWLHLMQWRSRGTERLLWRAIKYLPPCFSPPLWKWCASLEDFVVLVLFHLWYWAGN